MKKMELLALNQPAILSLIGTPPQTPDPQVEQQLLPGLTPLTSAPASTRTPRKLQNPQKSTSSEKGKRDSVIVSFKLVQHEDRAAPSLSISTTAVAGSSRLSRVKRRLFTSDYDSMDGSDSDMRDIRVSSGLSLSRVVRKPKCSPVGTEMDGTDADDEMEHMPYSLSYPSPPYSPAPDEQNSPADTSPSESIQQQSHRKASSGLVTPKVKTCASCKTKKTPLWRDSDDGTPYCNACGIRFKKYHVRCSVCFYIPRKDEKINNSCCLCGARLVHCRHH